MKCDKCKKTAVINTAKPLCSAHFFKYFESKVADTIKKHGLLRKNEKIAVAASGGKDSTALMLFLKRLGYGFDAIAIDEGIEGYRAHTLADLKKFCKQNKIPLKIYSYKQEFGMPLDEMLKKLNEKPCRVCGVFRRYLLNKKTKGYDKIATGHNLDDEAQSVMMNLLKANMTIAARTGPKTGIREIKGLTQRVKPFYFCTQKEVAAYALLNNLEIKFVECPNMKGSFREFVQESLNDIQLEFPDAKKHIVANFLNKKEKLVQGKAFKAIARCENCGEPSERGSCKACQIVQKLNA